MTQDLSARIAFLNEADRLKSVERSNVLLDLSRAENSGEHSWHVALFALILAPLAEPDVSIPRVIRMLMLHDLVEIDVGDHPIHEAVDWDAVALAEDRAAKRLFGLLPADQGAELLSLWQEFEADETPDARFAKHIDRAQPLFQVLCAPQPRPDHLQIVRDNLETGRGRLLKDGLPDAYVQACSMLTGEGPLPLSPYLPFLAEADRLKQVIRASRLLDDSRFENSAEHSWHVMLYALVLGPHTDAPLDLDKVITMLLLHDIVEIDAGDNPIHGTVSQAAKAAQEAQEQAAADRLFGLLPDAQNHALRAIWEEFEAAQTPEARFGKAIDRTPTPIANMFLGGGSWIDYKVTMDQLDLRVGTPINAGAPQIWDWLRPQLAQWFEQHSV